MKKVLRITLLTLLGITILAGLSVYAVLFTGARDRLLNKLVSPYIEGRISTARPHLHIANLSTLDIEQISIENEDSVCLAGIEGLGVKVDLKSLIHDDGIFGSVCVDGITLQNLDFLKPQESDIKEDTSAFSPDLPRIDFTLTVKNTRISWDGLVRNAGVSLSACLRNIPDSTLFARVDLLSRKLNLNTDGGAGIIALEGLRFNAEVMRFENSSTPDGLRTIIRSRSWRKGADSLAARIPDYLRDESFRSADINLELDSTITKIVNEWNPRGSISLGRAVAVLPSFPLKNTLDGFSAEFDSDHIRINSLNLKSGTSDFSVKGELKGLRRTLFEKGRGIWNVDLNVHSSYLNANEILAALNYGKTDEAAQELEQNLSLAQSLEVSEEDDSTSLEQISINDLQGVEEFSDLDVAASFPLIVVPSNIIGRVEIKADSARYDSFRIDKMKALIEAKRRCVKISGLQASTDAGKVYIDGFYSTKTREDISAGLNLAINSASVDGLERFMPSIDSLVPLMKSISGNLDCELAATARLDTNMGVVPSSVDGIFKIKAEGVKMAQEARTRKITRLLLFKDRDSLKLGELNINGMLTSSKAELFPMLISLDRYRIALSGTQELDNKFDYRVSLLKAPLLIFRFGVRLYGSDFDHLKWRLCPSQFKNTEIPSFAPEVEMLQERLKLSIDNVLDSGVDKALSQSRGTSDLIAKRKHKKDYSEVLEELSESQLAEIEKMTTEMDVESFGEEADKAADDAVSDILSLI